MGGEYRRGLPFWSDLAAAWVNGGLIGPATTSYAVIVRCHVALGNFGEASAAYQQGLGLAGRLEGPSLAALDRLTSAERHVGAVANPRRFRTKASGSGAAHTEPRWETSLAVREERLCARVAPVAG
jgi:hypothetical protein